MRDVCDKLSDPDTMCCVSAERVVMRKLEGGCQVPIGAYARIEGATLVMDAFVGSVDGKTIIRHRLEGSPDEPIMLGEAMVDRLLDVGADAILAEIRNAADVDDLLKT
jgi:hydroxymethylbilane synthase